MDVKERRKAVEFLSDVSNRYKAFEHLKKSICDNMYQDIFLQIHTADPDYKPHLVDVDQRWL